MTASDIANKYERLVIQQLLCENAMEMAIAWLNAGKIHEAQDLLQGALLTSQLSKFLKFTTQGGTTDGNCNKAS